MDIPSLNIPSISLIELLKLLITVLDALASGGTQVSQTENAANNEYSVNHGKSTALFAGDLYGKTINFLKNNFKQEELAQINDKINWGKQELKPAQSCSHSW